MTFSTLPRDEIRKKRVKRNSSFGNLSGISEVNANHELSSEEETSEEAVKKPRLTSEDYETGSDFSDDPELDTRMVTEDDVRGKWILWWSSLVRFHSVILALHTVVRNPLIGGHSRGLGKLDLEKWNLKLDFYL